MIHPNAALIESAHILRPLVLFARGGGGGSGSGGGGAGSGIIAIGYLPMHFIGAWLRRLKAKHQIAFDIFQVVGWLVALVYVIILIAALRSIGVLAGVGACIGMGAGLYGWYGKLKQSKRTRQALQSAALQDHAWDEATLLTRTAEVFQRYQTDWSNYDTEAMKAYMTPTYQYHASLIIYALQQAGRRNLVTNAQLQQSLITEIVDSPNNAEDVVVVGITAQADDRLIDSSNNKQLFRDTKPFTEFWRFRRRDNVWLLDGIQQATASHWMYNPGLERLAQQNGYYFSADWGWLLLPRRGQLFGKGKFGVSDINNHVIGVHGQCLAQLYTYSPVPRNRDSYLIAQTNLPRSYGNIVVRRHSRWPFGLKGLRKVSTEWPDFNKKYDVYATSSEQATSLELLNPLYMEKLEALPFEVNIEVVDNVVYLYTKQIDGLDTMKRYQTMLNILNDAFREMRL